METKKKALKPHQGRERNGNVQNEQKKSGRRGLAAVGWLGATGTGGREEEPGEKRASESRYIWNHSGERGRREGAKRMAGAGGEAEQGARPSMGGREDGRGWEGEGEVHLFCQRM